MHEDHPETFGGLIARERRRGNGGAGNALAAVGVLPVMEGAAEAIADHAATSQVDALMLAVPRQRVHDATLPAAEKHNRLAAEREPPHPAPA